MGLSSSQARLLSLTGRMHDIEYKAQRLEAQKLQLANETRRVNEDYLNALDAIKIQARALNSDGSSTYYDATFNNLIYSKTNNSIYILKDIESGKVYCSDEIRSAFANSDRTVEGFLKTLNSLRTDKSSYTSITSVEQLASLSGATGNFKLDADLVLDNWDGIKSFKGTFDGNGHTITINNSKFGLFRSTEGATLRNVELNVDITNHDRNNIGGLACYISNSTVENCSVNGVVNGNRWLGGALGYTTGNCTISNSTANVEVNSDLIDPSNGTDTAHKFDVQSYAGGFIGANKGSLTVENCRAEGNVTSEYEIIGGFIGMALTNATFNNVVATGDITANRSGAGNIGVYDYTVNYHRSNMFGSGTFLGEFNRASEVTFTNCYAYGMPTNKGTTAGENYVSFGTNDPCESPNTINSYSRLNGDLMPAQTMAIPSDITTTYPNIDAGDMDYLVGMFNILNESEGGIAVDDSQKDNPVWLSNMLTNGFAMLAKFEVKANRLEITDTSVAVDTNLREVSDEILLKKAEAKYEADMKRIDLKDSKYDSDLAAIDSERNAIKQEIETLKTVAKDNVERTFKLFT